MPGERAAEARPYKDVDLETMSLARELLECDDDLDLDAAIATAMLYRGAEEVPEIPDDISELE